MLSLTASDFSGCYVENCVRKFWKQAELQQYGGRSVAEESVKRRWI